MDYTVVAAAPSLLAAATPEAWRGAAGSGEVRVRGEGRRAGGGEGEGEEVVDREDLQFQS